VWKADLDVVLGDDFGGAVGEEKVFVVCVRGIEWRRYYRLFRMSLRRDWVGYPWFLRRRLRRWVGGGIEGAFTKANGIRSR